MAPNFKMTLGTGLGEGLLTLNESDSREDTIMWRFSAASGINMAAKWASATSVTWQPERTILGKMGISLSMRRLTTSIDEQKTSWITGPCISKRTSLKQVNSDNIGRC